MTDFPHHEVVRRQLKAIEKVRTDLFDVIKASVAVVDANLHDQQCVSTLVIACSSDALRTIETARVEVLRFIARSETEAAETEAAETERRFFGRLEAEAEEASR